MGEASGAAGQPVDDATRGSLEPDREHWTESRKGKEVGWSTKWIEDRKTSMHIKCINHFAKYPSRVVPAGVKT